MEPPAERRATVEEYLAFEREAEFRHEYIDGEIVAMSGGSWAHARVAGNIFASLHTQLRGRRCRPYMTDMRLRVADSGLYTYPDIFVTCGEELVEEDGLVLADATLIVEVLSPSTEAYDRGEKWARYRRLESLSDYLLVSQEQPRIERFARGDAGTWIYSATSDQASVLGLASIGCLLALADVYDDVFEPSAS